MKKVPVRSIFKKVVDGNEIFIMATLTIMFVLVLTPAFYKDNWKGPLLEIAVNSSFSLLFSLVFYIFWRSKAKWLSLVAVFWGTILVDAPHAIRNLFYLYGLTSQTQERGPFHSVVVQIIFISTICAIAAWVSGDRREHGNKIIFYSLAMYSGMVANFLVDFFHSVGSLNSILWPLEILSTKEPVFQMTKLFLVAELSLYWGIFVLVCCSISTLLYIQYKQTQVESTLKKLLEQ